MKNKKTEFPCPEPDFDFPVITLAHGSGGKLTQKLLEGGVFQRLKNDFLDIRHDGAILPLEGQTAFSTDSFVINPVFFPGGNIGELAVNGTVNDVAMCGGIPQYLSLSFIIEEGLPVKDFWKILCSIEHAAREAGVFVVTGDTKVVDKGKGDKIFINTTGLGKIHPKADISPARIRPGDKIILSNHIAAHSIAILSIREGLTFETEIESDTTNLNHVIKDLLDKFGADIKFFRDPTRGGVATVLNETAGQTALGMEIVSENIPVLPQVKAACEMLGLDPLYSANEGVFIAIVKPGIADEMVHFLHQNPKTAKAVVLGEVTADHPGKVLMNTTLGGRRVVHMPVGEQLPRIC